MKSTTILKLGLGCFVALLLVLGCWSPHPAQGQSPNIALGADPTESSPGWGGGSYQWDITDGQTYYSTWARGLAFTGGTAGFIEPCGWRQATLNFGSMKTFNRALIWHHGLDHIPNTYNLQYWDGSSWQPISDVMTLRDDLVSPPPGVSGAGAVPTEHLFPTVVGSKIRYNLNNCDITHGWIYEFEVFNDAGCSANVPPTTYEGDTFTLTLGCENISANVFGFQVGHTVTAGASLVSPLAASYTAGTIFQGQPTLAGPNTLATYALSLQAGGTEATGDFTLGSVDYSALAPGQATFDLTNLILGDIHGHAIAGIPTTSATITIQDIILSLSGTVDPEAYAHADDVTLALEGSPVYASLTKTYNPVNGTTAFTFTNIKGHPAWLQADGPSHVACQETLTFPVNAGDEVLSNPLILLAGDVNSNNAIDIVDAAAIGVGYGQAPTGELDINHDGAVNILDLIHVGRNYGTTGPTDCTP